MLPTKAIVVVLALMGLNLLIIRSAAGPEMEMPIGPDQAELVRNFVGSVCIAAIAWAVVQLVSAGLQRRPRDGRSKSPSGNGPKSYLRGALIGSAVVVLEVTVLAVSRRLRVSPPVIEIAYYAILIVSGAAWARWYGSGPDAPVLTATVALFFLCLSAAIWFVTNRVARFEYGPERYLFAMWIYAGRMSMLPVDAVAAWSGWRLAHAIGPDGTGR